MTKRDNIMNLKKNKDKRGSRVRCILLTDGTRHEVSQRLTKLIEPYGVVSDECIWYPKGFDNIEEVEFHKTKFADLFDNEETCNELTKWWLKIVKGNQKTPNFDIVSTCTINGGKNRKGLLLVEAKAHDNELRIAEKGKKLKRDATANTLINHEHIGDAIADVSAYLQKATNQPWAISRDVCYQMSNRFAWSWKLASMGIPVILVYLGFLNADEMKDRGTPFENYDAWERAVFQHSHKLVPQKVWKCKSNTETTPLIIEKTPIIPLIKTEEIQLP